MKEYEEKKGLAQKYKWIAISLIVLEMLCTYILAWVTVSERFIMYYDLGSAFVQMSDSEQKAWEILSKGQLTVMDFYKFAAKSNDKLIYYLILGIGILGIVEFVGHIGDRKINGYLLELEGLVGLWVLIKTLLMNRKIGETFIRLNPAFFIAMALAIVIKISWDKYLKLKEEISVMES